MPFMTTSPNHAHNISTVSALTDDGDDVNPWEVAAHLSMEQQQQDDDNDRQLSVQRRPPQDEQPITWSESVQQTVRRFFVILDSFVCFLLIVWASVILLEDYDAAKSSNGDNNDKNALPKTALLLQAIVVSALTLRLVAANQCSVPCSLLLATLFASLALYCWVEPKLLADYLQRHTWLHVPWLTKQNDSPHRLPLVFLACAVWELLVRWSLDRCLLLAPEYNDNHRSRNIILETPTRNRPWWWDRRGRHNDRLARPLLDNDGLPEWVAQGRRQRLQQQSSSGSSWLWSPWRRRNPHDDHPADIRDDGSVDFASVQEEWATLSQEDPHWWSKEEEEEEAAQRRLPDQQIDTSWSTTAADERIENGRRPKRSNK